MALRRWLVFDVCMRFKRIEWRTDIAERMVDILSGRVK